MTSIASHSLDLSAESLLDETAPPWVQTDGKNIRAALIKAYEMLMKKGAILLIDVTVRIFDQK